MSEQAIRHDHSVDCAWDFYHCDPDALADPDLAEGLHADIVAAGFHPACEPPYLFRRFEGGGVSFVEVLLESHAAIHASPENAHCIEVTIHTCHIVGLKGKRKSPSQKTHDLYKLWHARLQPKTVSVLGARVRANLNSTICPPSRALQQLKAKAVK